MFTKHQNRVEFIDFGLAEEGPRARPRGTTAAYASSQQLSLADCTQRHDLVSLGITFIDLMTKILIFDSGAKPPVSHKAFLLRESLNSFDPLKIAINKTIGAISHRHEGFAKLCEEMMDDRAFPVLNANDVSQRLADFLAALSTDEYDRGRRAWESIPEYVPRIASKVRDIEIREAELKKTGKTDGKHKGKTK